MADRERGSATRATWRATWSGESGWSPHSSGAAACWRRSPFKPNPTARTTSSWEGMKVYYPPRGRFVAMPGRRGKRDGVGAILQKT